FVLILLITMLLDFLVELPWLVRAIVLGVNLVGSIGLLLWLGIKPAIFAPDEDEISLWVERTYNDFDTRLISAIQLRRDHLLAPGTSTEMIAAVTREAELIARPLDFSRVIQT